MDGLEVCRAVRAMTNIPIIVLSADGTEERKIAALDGGADDYIVKPFGMGELEARLRVAERHWQERSGATTTPLIEVGPLVVDLERHRVEVDGTPVELTPREFDLLCYLAKYPGKVLTHRMILAEIWGPGYVDEVHYLRVYVHRLRRIIGDEAGAFLTTVPGVGYTLVTPPADEEPRS
jgi:two-component system KDP operon response regulator KdpE